jgi:hypothetical protein
LDVVAVVPEVDVGVEVDVEVEVEVEVEVVDAVVVVLEAAAAAMPAVDKTAVPLIREIKQHNDAMRG